jgi:hypothetical protein
MPYRVGPGLALLAGPALGQTEKPRTPRPKVDEIPVVPSQSGPIATELETWEGLFADEPAVAFEKCSEQIAAGDLEKAGRHVLKAAEHTRIAAYGSGEELKVDLLEMERRLREYGEALKNGNAVPAADLGTVPFSTTRFRWRSWRRN